MIRKRLYFLCSIIIVGTILFNAGAVYAGTDEQHALSLTDEEKEYIASHKEPLKVGYVQDRVPVSFLDENGSLGGISRYIFDRLSEISGLKFDYVVLPTGEITYDYLLNEGFDLVTSVEYNEENKKARGILISEPYLSSRKVVVAKDNLEFRYDAHLSVAISTGSQTIRKVLGAAYPNFELIDYPSIADCLEAVNSGEADLMMQNQYVAEYWFSKPKYDKLKVIPVLGLDDKLCFSAVVGIGDMAGPSDADGRILISILDKSIASMTDDEIGTYTIQGIMENQYKLTLSDFLYRYRFAAIILGAAALIILTLAALLVRQRIRFAESRADAKAKGEFLSTMSHEIRTPLNGLIGLNYLMMQKLDNKEQLADYLQQSTVTAKYLLSLVNDILDTSKIQAQKLEPIMQPVKLDLLISTINSLISSGMADKKLVYNVNTEFINPCILGDEVRIQQVILNLLDNARKFTPEGGNIELSLRQETEDGFNIKTIVTVSDTGSGISEEFQKHIFEVFSQERSTVSKGNQGTGLGLFICRSLARLMNGDITLVSSKGKGSTFTFTFTAQSADVPNTAAEQPITSSSKGMRILVAEDNELNGEIILELLHNEGFEADLAENGKKAFQMFKDSAPNTYNAILMDLLMPEMDGFETAKAIRSLNRPDAKAVHIYACTANSFAEDRDKALASGMNDFITKPVNVAELVKKLKELD